MTIADVPLAAALPRWRHPATILIPLGVAITLAVVGAFGTYVSMTLPLRLLHFVSVALVVGGLAFALSESIRRFWFGGELPFWAMLAVAFVTAPPGAWVVHLALTVWAPWSIPYVTYPELTLQVLAPNLLIGSIAWALLHGPAKTTDVGVAQPTNVTSGQALRAKLPANVRHAAILALSAEDHYVRVRTDRGEALILINLANAIAALGENAGMRIHRSHWVSRQLVEGAAMHGSRHGLRVNDNTVLPVSRSGRKSLNAVWTDYGT
jgi:LytTr DNA-binding domain